MVQDNSGYQRRPYAEVLMKSDESLPSLHEVVLRYLGSGRYSVEWQGQALLASSDDPEFDACRALLVRGVTGKLLTRHGGSAHHAMLLDIQRGASSRTEEGRRVGPRRARWRPFGTDPLEGPAPVTCRSKEPQALTDVAVTANGKSASVAECI